MGNSSNKRKKTKETQSLVFLCKDATQEHIGRQTLFELGSELSLIQNVLT